MNQSPIPPFDYESFMSDPAGAFAGNCENVIGFTPIPLGLAGPVTFNLESKKITASLPLATTEACLVASVNRGFKALRSSTSLPVLNVEEVGITRSAAFEVPPNFEREIFEKQLTTDLPKLNALIEEQSRYTKLIKYETEYRTNILFINFYYQTGQAMGMNMATIATKKLSDAYFQAQHNLSLITLSANWCSDKKPSQQTADKGRKFSVSASVIIEAEVIETVLKTSVPKLLKVDQIKLRDGSQLAHAIGQNAHHANIVAASFAALGQDLAHTVDGSLGQTHFELLDSGALQVRVNIPALVCGTIGGGTQLPVQRQTLELTGLQKNKEGHLEAQELAGLIGTGVLAGELSLMAALSSHTLAESHNRLRRTVE